MRKDIKNFIKSCAKCQKLNYTGAKHKAPIQPMDMDLSLRPFQKIAIDIIGPMAIVSNRGHRFALTIIDMCSRWMEVIPIKVITAETICYALLSVFTRFGFPETILSDNGSQFRSQMTLAFTKLLEITQIFFRTV